ncbi:MAG: undecaprenyl-diphosphate phosphatase [Fidelibacterota bacterium]
MSTLEVMIIAIVQGLTEFLPVSSSGHMVLTEALFGLKVPGITLEIALHFGTFMSVLLVFRKEIIHILISFFTKIWKIRQIPLNYREDEWFRMAVLVLLSMIPAILVALFLRDFIEGLFESTRSVGIALIFTGLLLFITQWAPRVRKPLKGWNVLFMGIFQALAMIPGISRSGSTISAGLLAGVDREKIAKFSFIMALPLIIGATILEIPEIKGGSQISLFNISLGMLVAFLTGIVALKWLIKILMRGRLSSFSYYCVLLGFITVALS